MKNIWFRGRDTATKEWVYGDLMHIIGRPVIHTDRGHKHTVEPKTVGQYTWKTDKNSNRIFDGDIVRQTFEGQGILYEDPDDYDGFVVGTVALTGCGTFINPSYGVLNYDGEPVDDYKPRRKRLISYRAEVIGNIYDNPELLEVSF